MSSSSTSATSCCDNTCIVQYGIAALPNTSWENLNHAIYFYDSTRPYFDFSNFDSHHPIVVNEVKWKSTEHCFQAFKFLHVPKVFEAIKQAPLPRDALNFARQFKAQQRADWFQVNLAAMHIALRAKFTQYPELQQQLIDTEDQILIEDAGKNDAYWGAGEDFHGQNHLGRMLMHIRQELFTNTQSPYPVNNNKL